MIFSFCFKAILFELFISSPPHRDSSAIPRFLANTGFATKNNIFPIIKRPVFMFLAPFMTTFRMCFSYIWLRLKLFKSDILCYLKDFALYVIYSFTRHFDHLTLSSLDVQLCINFAKLANFLSCLLVVVCGRPLR